MEKARESTGLIAAVILVAVGLLGAGATAVSTPTASGSVDPPPVAPAVGYGAFSQGGAGGRVIEVTSLADHGRGTLRAALEATGPREVRFAVAGVIVLQTMIKLRQPFVTLDGATAPSPGIQIRGETLEISTHDVIIRQVRFRPGDGTADAPDDLDGLTIDGRDGWDTHDILLDHIEAEWGPDIGGLAILNNATDITVQHSILGEGLFRSRHHESHLDANGHSYAANIVGLSPERYPRRVTFYRNLLTGSEGRVPRVEGAVAFDLVNCLIYGFHDGPYGNPRSMNMVGNVLRTGPQPAAVGLGQHEWIWRPDTSDHFPNLFVGAVYEQDTLTDGFTGHREPPMWVYTDEVIGRLSVEPAPASGVMDSVLADVGVTLPTVDGVSRGLLDDVLLRGGTYRNGEGEDPPNPTWQEQSVWPREPSRVS